MKKDNDNNWIVCLGGEDWWYHSHAHFDIQMMKCLAARTRILYVCSIGMRMPSPTRDKLFWARIKRKLKSVSKLLQHVAPNLYVYSPLPLPIYQYNLGRTLNTLVLRMQLRIVYQRLGITSPLVWVNTPTAWPVIKSFQRHGLVYQRTDDYAAYDFDNFNTDYVRLIDDELIRLADLTLHVSDELHLEAAKKTTRALLLPQGVDERFFAQNVTIPKDLTEISRPIIGYVGGMDRHKFDTPLVSQVARNLPDFAFVLVGTPDPNTKELEELPNVHFLGVKSHDEIPSYIHNFDICMLPTARTEWGLKCRPLKLMEYLAAARPVIATPTPAARKYLPEGSICADASSWVNEIRRLMSTKQPNEPRQFSPPQLKPWSGLAEQIWQKLYD